MLHSGCKSTAENLAYGVLRSYPSSWNPEEYGEAERSGCLSSSQDSCAITPHHLLSKSFVIPSCTKPNEHYLGTKRQSSQSLLGFLRPAQAPAFPSTGGWRELHPAPSAVSSVFRKSRCLRPPAASVWLLSAQAMQSAVAREEQQMQLEVMSRRAGKASQVEGKSETLN